MNILLKFLFPKKCLSCQEKDFLICKECLDKLPDSPPPPESWIYSCFNYRDRVTKKIINYLKFNKKYSIIYDIQDIVREKFSEFLKQKKLESENIILIPIPLTRRSLKKRGYNQSKFIAKTLKVKIADNILFKKTNHLPQNKIKNKTERKANVSNSFVVRKKEKIKNRIFILIDDVTTTGATLSEAKKVLKQGGAKKVFAFTLAH